MFILFDNLINIILFIYLSFQSYTSLMMDGDWGLGIGDWGLGIGHNPQTPNPNPQTPNPTPPTPLPLIRKKDLKM